MKENQQTLLAPYRILDLADEKGLLCGKIFADMGADVIKVESPGGDPARRIGPFYHDDPDPEKSLYWFAYNTNKRGITLDIETKDGQEIFKRLVKTSDMVVESFDPGYMHALGLGYEDLVKINEQIIVVSITPFGQTGPYVDRKYRFNDMLIWALSGFMHPNGEPDRAPNQITFPQAYLNGAAEAACGAMTALYARELFGEGQHVDVSIQQALQTCNQMSMQLWDMYGVNSPRGLLKGGGSPRADGTVIQSRAFYPCKDGWIFLLLGGGALKAMSLSGKALNQLMAEEGMAGDLVNYDWATYDAATITQKEIDHQQLDIIGPYLKAKTKLEFYEEAIKRKILGCPFQDSKDIAESPQLAAREFFVEVEHTGLGDTVTHCGPYMKLSETPLKEWRRAPMIGEHNKEIYSSEMEFSAEELHGLKQAGVI